jgi:hypothetical protein
MDKELDCLAKKIVARRIEVPSSSNTRCIKKFYCEIISILENDRTLKSLVSALNENGFNIKYGSLSKTLSLLKKTRGVKTSITITNEQQNITTLEKITTQATPTTEEAKNKFIEPSKKKRMTILHEGVNIEPPKRMKTLREIEEETEREQRENKRPLY